LFYLTSSLVQGFALAFGFGVLVSMLTAILVTRAFLLAIATDGKKFRKILLGKVKRK
jgi:preprotein translocase subunit SecD